MSKREIIIGLIISFLIVPVFVVAIAIKFSPNNSPTLTSNPPARTDADIIAAVLKSRPSLANEKEEPVFKLVSHKRLGGNWYAAWLDDDTVKVLINDPAYDAASMQVLLGPGTVFSQSDATERGVPDNIYKEFLDAKVS